MSSIDASGNAHRAAGTPDGGQFTAKANTAPVAGLAGEDPGPTFYMLTIDGEVIAGAQSLHPEWIAKLRELRAVNPGKTIMLQASRPAGGGSDSRTVPTPEADEIAVVGNNGDYFPIEELEERGLSLIDVEVHIDKVLTFSDADERVDLDEVRGWLTASPGDGPYLVDAALSDDDPTRVNVDVAVTDNLLWNDMFTEEELDEHRAIVEAVYSEWFNAELDVPDSWETASVTLRTSVPRQRASRLLILEPTWSSYAKFRNETDPGTYGSTYVGHEIRRRIDAAVAEAGAGEQITEERQ